MPLTCMVKLPGPAVPPLSLITCLTTVNCGWMSLFVMVQVLVSPKVGVPEQPFSDSFS